MSGARVLLTGAFGNVGANALAHLVRLGHDAHAFDLETDANRRRQSAATGPFTTHWGDLTDPESVARAFETARPEVVLHTAALIAPLAFVRPALAQRVNVDGTRHLIAACERMDDPPRFVFTSSYTVHGPRNPYRDLPPIDGETPVAPADPYAAHKVAGEQMLADSALSWVVLRLPAVMATEADWGRDPAFLRFFFLLSPDRREHLLDSRDAGLALANAVEADGIVGRRFALGGPESDCRVLGIDFHRRGMAALGLGAMPESAFRRSHPDVDASWYAEDWVDTTASEQALNYQQHTFADHLEFKRRQAGASYWAMRALSPLIGLYMRRQSPRGFPVTPDPTPMWDVTERAFSGPIVE
jgi:nucleoside-diphosphate-sugar epimerase